MKKYTAAKIVVLFVGILIAILAAYCLAEFLVSLWKVLSFDSSKDINSNETVRVPNLDIGNFITGLILAIVLVFLYKFQWRR